MNRMKHLITIILVLIVSLLQMSSALAETWYNPLYSDIGTTSIGANTGTTDQYSSHWDYWSQGASANSTFRKYGCRVVAQAKLLVEAGIAPNNSSVFYPTTYFNWVVNKGYFSSGCYENAPLGQAVIGYTNEQGKSVSMMTVPLSGGNTAANDATIMGYLRDGYYCYLYSDQHCTYVLRSYSIQKGTAVISDSMGNATIYPGDGYFSQIRSYVGYGDTYGGPTFTYLYCYKFGAGGAPIINGNSPVNLGDQFYAYIRHIKTDRYLANQLDNIAGEEYSGNSKQIWHFTRTSNGSYSIENVYNGSYIDVYGASTTGGGNVYACPSGYLDIPNQRFYIYNMFGGYYFSPEHTNGKNMLDMSESTHNLEIWYVVSQEWDPQQFMIDPVFHMVNYDTNGGIDAPSADSKPHKQTIALSEYIPSREGYVFIGWAVDPEAKEAQYQPGDNFADDVDITLYAIWTSSILTLPADLTRIEAEAFTGLPEVYGVRIPSTVVEIADDAFDNTIVIFAPAGSYATIWASDHGLKVVEE